ncbi:hypothetical protein RAM_28530 [Amycolatopsis mediterranei S699]|uniref:Uncharacterized protein n=2 Tax=Amycolatopsis mediterranei TaxID=33910 RepID=A0A9R0P0S4_AMYMS|nr:hypothetical protein RAM_28530 [Amycolatopsis mediterranei S699]
MSAPDLGGATPKWPDRTEGCDDHCDTVRAGSPANRTSRVPTRMRQPKVAPPRQPDPFALSREQRRRGARVVASAADDAGDCARLLAILGLNPADGLTAPEGRL